jgi:endonuclease YncB( thermonuclease family)
VPPAATRVRMAWGRRPILVLLAVAAAALAAVVWLRRAPPLPSLAAPAAEVRVVDGDSLAFGERRVRLLGLDAPERAQDCRDGDREVPCGRRAREALERLVRGTGRVTCVVHGEDRFRRALGVCATEDGVDINRSLVREGWALAWRDDPTYAEEERRAARERRGIHAWDFVPPAEWRRGQR